MQPDISPLAKRLAEENNVDWQGLNGSGSDGRIVERDVLEYLARVMAGEEDLNPTPEPLPEGMEAWPEEDVATTVRRNAPSAAQAAPVGVADDFSIDEPVLDTDLAFEAVPSASSASGSYAAELDNDISDDIFLFDDALDMKIGNYQAVDNGIGTVSDDTPGEVEADFDFSDLDTETPKAISPQTSGSSDTADFELDDLQAAEFDGTNSRKSPDSLTNMHDDEILEGLEVEQTKVPDHPDSQTTLFDESAPSDADAEAELPLFIGDGAATDAAEVQPSRAETSSSETPAHTGSAVGAPSATHESGAGLSSAAVSAPAPTANLQLVSYGLLLRRHIDLSSLMQAQAAVGQELGQAGPVAPSSLLLRAAAKALAKVSLSEQSEVGLAVFGDQGVRVAAIKDVMNRPFREIAAEVAQPETGTEQNSAFGIIVADMSELDIDEAVLNAGAPVLTLGRILYDSSEGSHHSTLALSGEVTVDQGTKFLAAVADLLDSPIRLVV